ncbi:MAG: hypothetical protein DME76_19155 [Verrucomicrobia bacterium]|nr:MAG: hypothetical protein DME76_19155 [Verrucomicrobiota bacterium]
MDGYKRPLVGSLSANLQRFGMEKVAKVESLQEIIEEMTESFSARLILVENSVQSAFVLLLAENGLADLQPK